MKSFKSRLNLRYIFYVISVSFGVNEVLTFDVPLTDPPVIDASNLKLGFKVIILYTIIHMEAGHLAEA